MKYGIAISWPSSGEHLRDVVKSRRIPIRGHPRQVAIEGTRANVVGLNGEVLLTCVLETIDGPKRVRLADGKVAKTGYELVAKMGSVKTRRKATLGSMTIKWRALGQLRYFNEKDSAPVTFTDDFVGGAFLNTTSELIAPDVRLWSFSHAAARKTLSAPERDLITRYMKWIGGEEYFRRAQLLDDGTWTDLFNRTRWTLFEAKISTNDGVMREAFGQLHDYRRWFSRKPALAILVPKRPSNRILAFADHYGVIVVWEQKRGSFGDSSRGRLSRELRAVYRERLSRK